MDSDGRQRIASSSVIDRQDTNSNSNDSKSDDHELMPRHSTVNESNVDPDLLNTHVRKAKKSKLQMLKSIFGIALEGDLAGFQIAWLCMSTGFVVLKIFGITDVVQRIQWWAIFAIPILNALLTAWFDYIITKYRSTKKTVE